MSVKPLAVVATHPIQYQTPLYRALSQAGIPLHVLFLTEHGLKQSHDPGFGTDFAWDIPLLDGYSYEFVRNRSPMRRPFHPMGLINPALLTILSPQRFSAVLVHGYRSVSMLAAMATAKARGMKVLYRAESPGPVSAVDRIFGTPFRNVVDVCLAIGTRNAAFYRNLGVEDERIFLAPYAVDNARFQTAARHTSKGEARARLGLRQDAAVVIFVGKLLRWKSPDLLLDAAISLERPDLQLVFVGDGPLRAGLEDRAKASDADVAFVGFLNQTEIPHAYQASDLLVLPSSREPWGLVVNEAMNFGVPALVSDEVGCGPDLVLPGRTGAVFEAGSVESLRRELGNLMDREHLVALGQGARERISNWGFAQCIEGFRAALNLVGES